jgi:pilus assembly protein Flp/PilA
MRCLQQPERCQGVADAFQWRFSRSSKWQTRREAATQSYGPASAGRQAAEWVSGAEQLAHPIIFQHDEVRSAGRASVQVGPGLRERGMVMRNWCAAVVRFIEREDGPTAVEYAVMLALIIVVCIAAITTVGQNASSTFNNVALNTAVKSSAS